MADGSYESGLALHNRFAYEDVRVLILNNSGTPVFNAQDANLDDVLARAGNVEEANTRDKVVPSRTVVGDRLDHGDITYTTPASGTWVAAIYYIKGDSDGESPVLYFKDAAANPAGAADVTLATGASGLVDVVHSDRTTVLTSDENDYSSRVVHADLNLWADTHQALVITDT